MAADSLSLANVTSFENDPVNKNHKGFLCWMLSADGASLRLQCQNSQSRHIGYRRELFINTIDFRFVSWKKNLMKAFNYCFYSLQKPVDLRYSLSIFLVQRINTWPWQNKCELDKIVKLTSMKAERTWSCLNVCFVYSNKDIW